MTGRACPNCGAGFDPTDKFCRNCGQAVAVAAPEAPARQDFLELDDDSRTLAAGYVPPSAPLPYIREQPPIDRSVQNVPNTLAGGYRTAPMAEQQIARPIIAQPQPAAPSASTQGYTTPNFGAQSGRCPRCGLNLPIFREKCPNCGANVIPIADQFTSDSIRPKINVRSYELTQWPWLDFLIGVLTFFLLTLTAFIPGLDYAPYILIPIVWMVSRLFWRWFARGLGLAMLIGLGIQIYMGVVYLQHHPIKMPTVTVPE